MRRRHNFLVANDICRHLLVKFWTVRTIWSRNSAYSCGVTLADALPPSMCWNMSAPSDAYATRDRLSKRWGKNLQKRAAHFLDSAFTLIPLFSATDIFPCFFSRRRSCRSAPAQSACASVRLALCSSTVRGGWREAVNAPHHPYTHYWHRDEASGEIRYSLHSPLLTPVSGLDSFHNHLHRPSQSAED